MNNGRKIDQPARSAEWAEAALHEYRDTLEYRGNGSSNVTQRQVLERIELVRSKKPRLRDELITLAHGAGGKRGGGSGFQKFSTTHVEPQRF